MFSEPGTEVVPSVSRVRALDRSIGSARARSVDRYERLVQAARDLANERHSAGFTVHEVAERAGCSLKGFYRCFASKDDLLVALLAEDSLIGAAILDERVRAHADPRAQVRACVTELFELCALPGATGYARVLVTEHRRLFEERTDDLRAALDPIVRVVARTIDDARRHGLVVSESPARDAETVFSLVLDGIHAVTLGWADPRERAEYLWGFCGRALSALEPSSPSAALGPTDAAARSREEHR